MRINGDDGDDGGIHTSRPPISHNAASDAVFHIAKCFNALQY